MRWLAHVLTALVLAALVATLVASLAMGASALDGLSFLLLLAATLVVGWLLAWKRPKNPMGWLFLAFTALFALQIPAMLLGTALYSSLPGVSTWLYWYGSSREDTWSWIPPIWILLTQIPLHFPNGRLPSPRWRWFRSYTVIALVVACLALSTSPVEVYPGVSNPTYVRGLTSEPVVVLVVFIGLLAPSFIGAIASLLVRYRKTDATERAQLRWVLWGLSIAVTVLLTSWIPILRPFEAVLQGLVLAAYALVPISIAIAVLRYRLYDIDRIISRTASYGLVTLTVLGIYLLVVTSATMLLPGLPAIGVAVATLAAAALFLPLLRLVQRWVDRRFNREQYNATRVVDAFGERLRTGADPHTAADDLVSAVEQTLQPASVGIWTPDRSR